MLAVMHPNQPFQQRPGQQDWDLYPEPPTNIDMTQSTRPMAAEAYPSYQDMMAAINPMGLDTWPDAQQSFLGQVSSPSLPSAFDEAELQVPPSNLSTASAPSASSSTAGSPQSHHGQLAPMGGEWQQPPHQGGLSIVGQDLFPSGTEYQAFPPSMDDFHQQSFELLKPQPGFDPTILHPDMRPMGMGYDASFQPQGSVYPPPSPAMSSSPQPGAHSPSYNHFPQAFHSSPFPPPMTGDRRQSTFSIISHEQPSHSGDESGKEKQRCPHHDCGKVFKDLKAHMLTHQNERPEKCPITTCEYHVKGFARKYDKNRHTLTHYKGTMVCGFCPGSGSAAEKSFNRADVFKRHLTAVHGVEQTPPNSRKKTSAGSGGKKMAAYPGDTTGKCSTCSVTFSNAQEFYEHLDECVLRIVQQEDPAEAINAQRLAEVESDKAVHDTLEKNHLPTTTPSSAPTIGEADEDDVDMGEEDDEDAQAGKSPIRKTVKVGPANGIQKSKGMTHSRGGVSLPTKGRTRKSRRDYPSSWGFDKGQMTMKKRVMAVFDGPRRLAKDDMMLCTEHEVRVKLADGKSYVTDLDVQTMRRAEGFHQATEEEKGPWISDDPTDEQFQAMVRLSQ